MKCIAIKSKLKIILGVFLILPLIFFFVTCNGNGDGSITGDGITSDELPGHLNILAATIEEMPPFELQVFGRTVWLSIELADTPTCSAETNNLSYGFLFDSDLNNLTGQSAQAFEDLGVDARISVNCNPETGTFESTLGTVTITPLNEGAVLLIETTVDRLPAVNLRFIVYAFEDGKFVRLPTAPDAAAWAILEIRRP